MVRSTTWSAEIGERRGNAAADGLRLAGQHPRAAKHHRARGDFVARQDACYCRRIARCAHDDRSRSHGQERACGNCARVRDEQRWFARRRGAPRSVSEEAMQRLTGYAWPGNIRELQNIIERAVILSRGKTLVIADELRAAPTMTARVVTAKSGPVEIAPASATNNDGSLDDVERRDR